MDSDDENNVLLLDFIKKLFNLVAIEPPFIKEGLEMFPPTLTFLASFIQSLTQF